METLNGRLPLEDSSDFDDSVCVFIVMTRSFILDTLQFFRFFFVRRGAVQAGWGVGGGGAFVAYFFVFIKKFVFLSKWHAKTYPTCLSCEIGMQILFTFRNRNLKTFLLTKSQSPINTISPIIMAFVLLSGYGDWCSGCHLW